MLQVVFPFCGAPHEKVGHTLSLDMYFLCAADVSGGEAESAVAVGSGRRLADGQTIRLSFYVHRAQTYWKQSAPRGPQQDLPWYMMNTRTHSQVNVQLFALLLQSLILHIDIS